MNTKEIIKLAMDKLSDHRTKTVNHLKYYTETSETLSPSDDFAVNVKGTISEHGEIIDLIHFKYTVKFDEIADTLETTIKQFKVHHYLLEHTKDTQAFSFKFFDVETMEINDIIKLVIESCSVLIEMFHDYYQLKKIETLPTQFDVSEFGFIVNE